MTAKRRQSNRRGPEERSAPEQGELERRARRAQAIARVGEVIARSLDLAQVLETVADLTTHELGADMLLIWLAEEGKDGLRLAAQRNCPPPLLELVGALPPRSRSVAGLAIRSGKVQIVEDVAALGADFSATRETSAAGGFRSLVAVPLTAQGRLVGQLNYMLKGTHRFSGEEVEAITTIGHQFAVAIRNAELYEESRRANRALLLSNMRLLALLEQLPEGVAVADASGGIALYNGAAATIAGCRPAAAEGRHYADFFHFCRPDGRPAPPGETPIARVLATGEPVTGEQWRYAPGDDGRERHLLVNCAPLRGEGGKLIGAVAVCQDVTELRRLERMKDEFLAVASHELRTPVTSVKGYTQAILMRLSRRFGGAAAAEAPACRVECEHDQQQLQIVLRQINRLSELISELLDVSRLDGGRLDLRREPLDVTALVHATANRLQASTERHEIVVVVKGSPEPGEVQGDEKRLEQVLSNLIENAIQYSPQGGRIAVEIRVERTARREAASPASTTRDRVVVAVSDQGVGIPTDQLGLIFQRFYRASNALVRRFGGLGLGLHISREIVSRHGGQMWAESKEQQGSTFYFTLPVLRSQD